MKLCQECKTAEAFRCSRFCKHCTEKHRLDGWRRKNQALRAEHIDGIAEMKRRALENEERQWRMASERANHGSY